MSVGLAGDVAPHASLLTSFLTKLRARVRPKRLLPSSTAAQSAAILIGSITVAHLLFALFWMLFSVEARPGERNLAAQVALTVRIIEAVPPDQRQAAIRAASTPALRVTSETAGPVPAGLPDEPDLAIQRAIRAQLGNDRAEITIGRPAGPDSRGLVLGAHVGDSWLVFREGPHPRFRGPFGVYTYPVSILLLIGIPLVTLSLWAAHRVTSPLARLAAATETVSLDGERLPVPPNATVEIRRLAGSFNALVERLQKFAADRTGMLAAISHDLRTPLTRLRLRVESLDDEVMRTKMLRDIRAMGVMIGSALSYVEQQQVSGPLEQLDLAALLQTLCDEFVDSGFDVSYEGPLHCPAEGRPHALERALNNLIENAIKFGESATISLDGTGPWLVIDVCDSGPGVADDEKDKVLKPFYRTDAARGSEQGGIGLGLAIANTIVQRHGGTLELLDRTPQGLCVRIRLRAAGSSGLAAI